MPTVDVTEVIYNEEARELEEAYINDPKVRAAIDQFESECRLRIVSEASEPYNRG